MPPVPETSARPADPVANDYDSFAEAYSAENEASLLMLITSGPRCWPSPGTWLAGGSWTPTAAPATARDDRRLHRGRVPDDGHQ